MMNSFIHRVCVHWLIWNWICSSFLCLSLCLVFALPLRTMCTSNDFLLLLFQLVFWSALMQMSVRTTHVFTVATVPTWTQATSVCVHLGTRAYTASVRWTSVSPNLVLTEARAGMGLTPTTALVLMASRASIVFWITSQNQATCECSSHNRVWENVPNRTCSLHCALKNNKKWISECPDISYKTELALAQI